MIIPTNTNDRKALAKAIAEELGVPAVYMRAPSYGYQVGDFIIDRGGNIIGDNFEALQDFLRRNGYLPERPAEAQDAEPEQDPGQAPADAEGNEPVNPGTPVVEAPAPESHADSGDGRISQMEVSVPMENAAPAQLKNLVFILYSKQILINRMAQGDCLNIPSILIERLKESTPDTPEAFTELLDDSMAVAGMTGFDYRDGKVSVSFPFDQAQPEHWTAFANLLIRIVESAKKAVRVSPEMTVPDEQNEKYLAHVWLQRLGYGGADSKAERKILLHHLKGYCAFPNKNKMEAHMEKYTTARREKRLAEQETAVLEVLCEEADENA